MCRPASADKRGMLHVKEIEQIVDSGDNPKAHDSLDQLLELGPKNTAALKLKAKLYEYEGRFQDQYEVWNRVVEIDREDPDAIHYFLSKQMEDREHFYFTEDSPGGGRRFMAYPKNLIQISFIGLVGCIIFLTTTRLTESYPILAVPPVTLGIFSIFVLIPWMTIVFVFFRTIKFINVSPAGFELVTRTKKRLLKWDGIKDVYLARSHKGNHRELYLVMVPKLSEKPILKIDFNQRTTALRARSYLLKEISKRFGPPNYITLDKVPKAEMKIITY
jgi:tetratricopeptide (TPR) repeat protein